MYPLDSINWVYASELQCSEFLKPLIVKNKTKLLFLWLESNLFLVTSKAGKVNFKIKLNEDGRGGGANLLFALRNRFSERLQLWSYESSFLQSRCSVLVK